MYKHFGAQNQSGDVTYYLNQAFSSSTSFTHPFWTNLEEKLNKQKFRENIIHSSSSIRPTIVITIVVTVVLVCNVKWEVEGEHRSRFCFWKFFFEFACSENNCWATTAAAAVGPKNLKNKFQLEFMIFNGPGCVYGTLLFTKLASVQRFQVQIPHHNWFDFLCRMNGLRNCGTFG